MKLARLVRTATVRGALAAVVAAYPSSVLVAQARIPAGTPRAPDRSVVHEAPPSLEPYRPRAPVQPEPTPPGTGRIDLYQLGRNVHVLGPFSADELTRIASEDAAQGLRPFRIGIARSGEPIPISLDETTALRTDAGGGRSLWTLAVRSPGALAVRLHLSDFDAADGEVFVHGWDDARSGASGPFRRHGPEGTGDFWTPFVPGDTAYVDCVSASPPRLRIVAVGHADRDPDDVRGVSGDLSHQDGIPEACHLDAQCFVSSPEYFACMQATARIAFVDDADSLIKNCSGTLLNDLDPAADGPYFITAAHCIDSQSEASSMVVTWFAQTTSCAGALGPTQTTSGGSLLVTTGSGSWNDMSFLRLWGSLPPGVLFAGWSTAGLPTTTFGIHHPQGSFKRVTFFEDSWSFGCTFSADDYHFLNNTSGHIEGGSSGSGLFDAQGHLLGQLRGHCGVVEHTECDNNEFWSATYGEFEETYTGTAVADWLAIGGTLRVSWTMPAFWPQTGSPTFPFHTVGAAHGAAWDGVRIEVLAGSYPEALVLDKQIEVFATGGAAVIGA